MDIYELKAKSERQYLNGILYLAKGDLALASNYLRVAMKNMQECLPFVAGAEESEMREMILELAGHLKDINRLHTFVLNPMRMIEKPHRHTVKREQSLAILHKRIAVFPIDPSRDIQLLALQERP